MHHPGGLATENCDEFKHMIRYHATMIYLTIIFYYLRYLTNTDSTPIEITSETTYRCDNPSDCSNKDIICNVPQDATCDILCNEEYSCENTRIFSSHALYLDCDQPYSCYNSQIFCGNLTLAHHDIHYPEGYSKLNFTANSYSSNAIPCTITTNDALGITNTTFECYGDVIDKCSLEDTTNDGLNGALFICDTRWDGSVIGSDCQVTCDATVCDVNMTCYAFDSVTASSQCDCYDCKNEEFVMITHAPTDYPTTAPNNMPTNLPSDEPSHKPSVDPSNLPTSQPTGLPAAEPSIISGGEPTIGTIEPSSIPNDIFSGIPSVVRSIEPTEYPTTNYPSFGGVNGTNTDINYKTPTVYPTNGLTTTESLLPTTESPSSGEYSYNQTILSSTDSRTSSLNITGSTQDTASSGDYDSYNQSDGYILSSTNDNGNGGNSSKQNSDALMETLIMILPIVIGICVLLIIVIIVGKCYLQKRNKKKKNAKFMNTGIGNGLPKTQLALEQVYSNDIEINDTGTNINNINTGTNTLNTNVDFIQAPKNIIPADSDMDMDDDNLYNLHSNTTPGKILHTHDNDNHNGGHEGELQLRASMGDLGNLADSGDISHDGTGNESGSDESLEQMYQNNGNNYNYPLQKSKHIAANSNGEGIEQNTKGTSGGISSNTNTIGGDEITKGGDSITSDISIDVVNDIIRKKDNNYNGTGGSIKSTQENQKFNSKGKSKNTKTTKDGELRNKPKSKNKTKGSISDK